MRKLYIVLLFISSIMIIVFSDNYIKNYFNEIKNEVKIDTKNLNNILDKINDYKGPNFNNSYNTFYNEKYENLVENTDYLTFTDFNMQTYFANLDKYMPSNYVGSCGYVAVASALSYYDNFYNDDIIPEKYEFYENSSSLEEAKKVSPGLYNYSNYKTETEFYDYVKISTDYDFQSYLINMHKLEKNDNQPLFGVSDGEYKDIINLYFKDKINLKPKYKIFDLDKTKINIIKDIIKTNNPVLLGAKSKDKSGKFSHRFIAYGIAEDGDILINTGWNGKKYRNYKLSKLLKDEDAEIYNGITLSFDNVKIKRSNNYHINGKGYSGSNVNDDIITLGKLNRFLPPTFLWMKTNNPNEKYKLEFYNEEKIILEKEIKNFSQITLSYDTWIKNVEHIKMLKISFQRFDDTKKEYEKTYNYFEIDDIKFKKNKIDFTKLGLEHKRYSRKEIVIGKDKEEKIFTLRNIVFNKKDEIELFLKPFSSFKSSLTVKSNSLIGAISVSIDTRYRSSRKRYDFDIFIKNENNKRYVLYDFIKKDLISNEKNPITNDYFVNLILVFPKPINYFSIELKHFRTLRTYEIRELILYEKI